MERPLGWAAEVALVESAGGLVKRPGSVPTLAPVTEQLPGDVALQAPATRQRAQKDCAARRAAPWGVQEASQVFAAFEARLCRQLRGAPAAPLTWRPVWVAALLRVKLTAQWLAQGSLALWRPRLLRSADLLRWALARRPLPRLQRRAEPNSLRVRWRPQVVGRRLASPLRPHWAQLAQRQCHRELQGLGLGEPEEPAFS